VGVINIESRPDSLLYENLMARDHLDNSGVRREDTIEMDLKEIGSREFHYLSSLSLSTKN
jgi:hypothetical protein